MGRAALPLLVGSAALLAGVLYFETQPHAPLSRLSPETARQPLAHSHARPNVAQDGDARWSETILARPLFSPTRRPPRTVVSQTTAVVEKPRLAGVIIAAQGTGAIFVRQDGKPVFVSIGNRIGPYRIARIADGQVTVETATGTEILHPEFAQGASASISSRGSTSVPPATGAIKAPATVQIPSAAALRRMIERREK